MRALVQLVLRSAQRMTPAVRISAQAALRGFLRDGAAGRQVQQHLEAGAAQLQGGGLHAVVQRQAAHQYVADPVLPQVLDGSGTAPFRQVVVARTVGVQIRLDAFPDEEVVVHRLGQFVQQFEARRARHTVADPGEVGVGQGERLQHLCRLAHYPGRLRSVRVLAAQAQAGALGQKVQGAADGIAAGHRQFVGAERGEALLGIYIEAGDQVHGSLRLTVGGLS